MSSTSELRLFVSSTFRDMQGEREYLVRKVFPEIRAICRQRGVTFTEIDLRWGITDEEARRGQVVRICLEEIDRCRPFFIGILGARYGWQPGRSALELDPEIREDFPGIAEGLESGLSVTDIEFLYGALRAPDADQVTARFYRRDEPGAGSDAPALFADLVNRVQKSSHPLADFSSPEELGRMIRTDLLSLIDREWPADHRPSEHELQRRTHQAFARSRLRSYVPRPEYDRAIAEAIASPAAIVLLHGPSGLGKSALLAESVRRIRERDPESFVVEYFVGTGGTSRSPISLMRAVMHEIEEHFGSGVAIPSAPDQVLREFPDWLFRAGEKAAERNGEFVVAIDALNQLDADGRRLTWLPRTLPENLTLLLSTTPGEITDRLSGRTITRIEIGPLDDHDLRRGVVMSYLTQFRKKIPDALIEEITNDPKGRSPLYLRLLAEQLRQHGSHETLQEQVRRYSTAADLDEAFERRLEELESDFGREPVTLFFSALHASREGLMESEILDITDLSRLALSPLLFALDFNVLQGNGPLQFGHDFLRRAVRRRYLTTDEIEQEWHLRLARYFDRQPPSDRTSGELAWQFFRAGDTESLVATLASIDHFLHLGRGEKQLEVMAYWSPLRESFDIVEAYREGLRRWRSTEIPIDRELDALGSVADLLREVGEWTEAEHLAEEKRTKSVDAANRSEEAQALALLSQIAIDRGEFEEALTRLDEGRRIFDELDDNQGVEVCIGNSAQVYLMQGDFDNARLALKQAGEIAEQNGRIESQIKVMGNLGISYLIEGRSQDAMTALQRAIDLAREIGDYRKLALAIGNTGHAWQQQGQHDRALEAFRADLQESRKLGDLVGISRSTSNMASALIDLARYDEAERAIDEQLEIDRELGDRTGIAAALGNRGIIEAGKGQLREALATFREQLRLCEELGQIDGANRAIRSIANCHYRLGESDKALALFTRSIDDARSRESSHDLRRLLELQATLLYNVLITSEKLPDFLDAGGTGTDRERRADLIDRIEGMADEMAEHYRRLGESPPISATLLRAQAIGERALITSDRGLLDSILEELTDRIASCTSDTERAELHRALYEIAERHGEEIASEHRREALRLYTTLYEQTPTFDYRDALRGLESSGEDEG